MSEVAELSQIAVKHIDITEEARIIFGTIVEQAYIAMPKWADEMDFQKNQSVASDTSIEPNDGYPVFFKFTNGKSFEMRSSEWGGVYSATEEEYLKDSFN